MEREVWLHRHCFQVIRWCACVSGSGCKILGQSAGILGNSKIGWRELLSGISDLCGEYFRTFWWMEISEVKDHLRNHPPKRRI